MDDDDFLIDAHRKPNTKQCRAIQTGGKWSNIMSQNMFCPVNSLNHRTGELISVSRLCWARSENER